TSQSHKRLRRHPVVWQWQEGRKLSPIRIAQHQIGRAPARFDKADSSAQSEGESEFKSADITAVDTQEPDSARIDVRRENIEPHLQGLSKSQRVIVTAFHLNVVMRAGDGAFAKLRQV